MLTKEVTHEYILAQKEKIKTKEKEMDKEYGKFTKEQNEKKEQLQKIRKALKGKKVKQN